MTTPSTRTPDSAQAGGAAPSVIVFGVGDLDAARTLYTATLGVEPYADTPYYVGYRVGDVEIGLDPHPAQGAGTPVAYWSTEDIHGRVEALVAAGATVRRPPSDVGGGLLVAVLADADGNLIGLRAA